ncbi:MAG: IS66 family transposase zinc-finger binding domain-containing protein [Planctomycetes bacterium]|nr:IS66 family transposase zinc-finger binding domain-containing protein [Planctomycetota bacterium]
MGDIILALIDETQSSSSPSPSTPPAVAIPDDVEALQQLVRERHDALPRKQRENEQLQHRLPQRLKARFGPRADRLNPNQLVLFATEILEKASEPAPARDAKAKSRSKGNGPGRRKLPADLPRKQIVHDLSEEEMRCPCCGTMRVRIGQETSEQLEYEPAKLYVIEHVRPTYACKQCEGPAAESGPQIITASKPLSPIEKGLAGPGLRAQVITSKYRDPLPLYRQEDIFGRSGHRIPRNGFVGQTIREKDQVFYASIIASCSELEQRQWRWALPQDHCLPESADLMNALAEWRDLDVAETRPEWLRRTRRRGLGLGVQRSTATAGSAPLGRSSSAGSTGGRWKDIAVLATSPESRHTAAAALEALPSLRR